MMSFGFTVLVSVSLFLCTADEAEQPADWEPSESISKDGTRPTQSGRFMYSTLMVLDFSFSVGFSLVLGKTAVTVSVSVTTTALYLCFYCFNWSCFVCIRANRYDFGVIFTLFNSNYAITIIIAILCFFVIHWTVGILSLHNHLTRGLLWSKKCIRIKVGWGFTPVPTGELTVLPRSCSWIITYGLSGLHRCWLRFLVFKWWHVK